MTTGIRTEPRQGKTVAEIQRQSLVKRFNTGRIPAAGEIAIGGQAELDIDGFVQKAKVLQVTAFAEGLDPTCFDVEFFEKDAPHDATYDRYLQYWWLWINTQDVDTPDPPFVLEDQEVVKMGVTVPTKKRLHVRITNQGSNTMHVTDIELQFEELIP